MGSIASLIADITNTSGQEFDAIAFYDTIYNSLKMYRSDYALSQNQIFRNAAELSATKKESESVVNTFYRLIGFPAIRDDAQIQKLIDELSKIHSIDSAEITKIKSQNGTLNYFPGLSQDISEIVLREQNLYIPATLEASNIMLLNPLDLNSGASPARTTRSKIFPMKVLADVPIFPINKRMAPIFNNGDYITERSTKLSRPFIENAFYMRSFSPNLSEMADAIKIAIAKNFINDKTNDELLAIVAGTGSSTLSAQESALLKNLNNLNLIQLQIVDKMIKAMKQAAIDYRETRKLNDNLRSEVNYVPLIKGSPQEKTGSSETSLEDLLSGKAGFNTNDFFKSVLDEQISELEKAIALINISIQVAPNDKSKKSDQIRKATDAVSGGLNIVADVFMSEFLDIASFDKINLESNLRDLKEERNKKIQNYELVRKKIQIYSGEFVGLSVFDILSIFLALFTVDLDVLLGLMNPEARERIKSLDFYSGDNQAGSTNKNINTSVTLVPTAIPSVDKALTTFENKVKEYLDIAKGFFDDSIKTGQDTEK